MRSILTKTFLIGSFSFSIGLSFGQDIIPLPDYCPTLTKSPKQEEIIYDYVDEPAEFPGGLIGMREFLRVNFKYPERAEELDLQGKCYLKLTIWKTGEIKEVKVKKGVVDCPECDQEAIRLVRLMPKWLPGKVNGAAVNSYFILPIVFKVN